MCEKVTLKFSYYTFYRGFASRNNRESTLSFRTKGDISRNFPAKLSSFSYYLVLHVVLFSSEAVLIIELGRIGLKTDVKWFTFLIFIRKFLFFVILYNIMMSKFGNICNFIEIKDYKIQLLLNRFFC